VHSAGARRVIVVRAQQVEAAISQLPGSRVAPGIGSAGRLEPREAVLKNSPLVKLRPEWQVVHLPFPMKIWSPRWAGVE